MEEKLLNISILRAIATILVVLIHVTATALVAIKNINYFLIIDIISSISKCAVYTFIFISAFLLSSKYKNKRIDYFKFQKRRLSKVLIPYIIWSTIYYIMFVYKGFYSFDVIFYLKNLLLGNHLYHLYFIIIIIQFYLLFPLFIKFIHRFNSSILFIVLFIINALFSISTIPYKDRIFINYILIFYLGLYAGNNINTFHKQIDKYKNQIIVLFVAMVSIYSYVQYILYFKNIYFSYVIANISFILLGIIGAIFYYLVSKYISEKTKTIRGILYNISLGSFYIYLSHPLILLLVNSYFKNNLSVGAIEKGVVSFLIIGIVVTPLSIVYNQLKIKMK